MKWANSIYCAVGSLFYKNISTSSSKGQ